MQLSETISHLLSKSIPFVSWQIPGTHAPVTWVGECIKVDDIDLLQNHLPAFVMHPFNPDSNIPILAIKPKWKCEEHMPQEPLPAMAPASPNQPALQKPYTSSYQDYITGFEQIINALQQKTAAKIVLSRVIASPKTIQPDILYFRLLEKYPRAFVYLFSDGAGQCWAGASPETLLRSLKGMAETVSLAGTRISLPDGKPEKPWGQKEFVEQAMVSEMIEETLTKAGISAVAIKGPADAAAGPVVHLKTSFRFRIPIHINGLSLAQALHPTPAVCGTPTQEAKKTILRTEKHHRSYYTGFLGPVTDKHNLSLFVNLRCAQFINNECFIYSGGGITEKSDPVDEWQETENKAKTLLDLT
jgi:isochorismate synthase